MDPSFLITASELDLRFEHAAAKRKISFAHFQGTPRAWKEACLSRLTAQIGIRKPDPAPVRELRRVDEGSVSIHALCMDVNAALSVPGYLLEPPPGVQPRSVVLALHGHGTVGPCLGLKNDYHHSFALELAQFGHRVLCPELRGFGALEDVARQREGAWLDYWTSSASRSFTLVTEGLLYGQTLLGQTVEDLLRWETWLTERFGQRSLDVAGISYGGDLALLYPIFSNRVGRIFASGSLGSFEAIFSRCQNAPAHVIPGILEWMDRSDIAGLNAPRPLLLHYGALDRPSAQNRSAAFNETVDPAFQELRAIYGAFNAEDAVQMIVSPNLGHEMDGKVLFEYLKD